MAARYGKNPVVAAIVSVIAVAGVLPYIALQLKAVTDGQLPDQQVPPVAATKEGPADTLLPAQPLQQIAELTTNHEILAASPCSRSSADLEGHEPRQQVGAAVTVIDPLVV